MSSPLTSQYDSRTEPLPDATLQAITQALSGLQYGQVSIIVQNGRVMQIDRTDRIRLPQAKRSSDE